MSRYFPHLFSLNEFDHNFEDCCVLTQGQVITFMDSHCECAEGWLEPLLSRIALDRTTVVCPSIDVISDKTFKYMTASDNTWGGFNWKLNFRWFVEWMFCRAYF